MCNIHTANSWLNELPARGKTKCTMYIYKTNDAMNYTYRLGLAPHNFKHLNVMCQALLVFAPSILGEDYRQQLARFVVSSCGMCQSVPSPTCQVIAHYPLCRRGKKQHLLRLLWGCTCAGQLVVWVGWLRGLSRFAGWLSLQVGELCYLVSYAGQLACGLASCAGWLAVWIGVPSWHIKQSS